MARSGYRDPIALAVCGKPMATPKRAGAAHDGLLAQPPFQPAVVSSRDRAPPGVSGSLTNQGELLKDLFYDSVAVWRREVDLTCRQRVVKTSFSSSGEYLN